MSTEPTAKHKADLVITGAAEVLTCVPAGGDPAGRRPGTWVAIAGDRILAVGSPARVLEQVDTGAAAVLDAGGKVVAPGFVDCHTHLVFGGSRSLEYAARMTRTAAEVRALGIPTGIQATVAMTRAESVDSLTASAASRLRQMFRHGTTTVESKSGYGLSLRKEMEQLEVNHRLQAAQPVDVVGTFLGAHDFPAELSRAAYMDLLIDEMIPEVAVHGLADFCDVYCDEGYYTTIESRRILEAGQAAGLRPKIHVDAYADIGGAAMAAELGVVSADHLNLTDRASMRRLARAGVVGVVMPALDWAVRHPRPFDARAMLAEGMTLALATDLCPGCWVESMVFVMQLACRLYQFSPEEALYAATAGAARALGLERDRGSLEPGKLADLQIWDLPAFEEVIYRLAHNPVETVIKRGVTYSFREGCV
ncbi:MAG TPA: imidazolonepropionase [Anaerolineae bacterium]|nr:imidazolonepropionase [Anaerolineae bacterium]